MQQKYELGTRLTYFWHKNEKKISLNFIFVFEPLRFRHTCPSFLLSKFASQIKLIQSVVGSVASLRILGSHFQGPGWQSLVSRGPRVPSLGSHGPGSQVSGPDFRLGQFLRTPILKNICEGLRLILLKRIDTAED